MSREIDPNSLGFLVTDVARLWRGVMEREIEADALPVTAAEARVLAHIARAGAVRQKRLAASLGVAPMSLTGFLDRMEAAGLIARDADPDDRRAKIVTLTDAADPVLDRIVAIGARMRVAATRGLCDDDLETFRKVALGLRRNLDATRCAATGTEPAA
ncbi:MAG: MarR family transcriptional regulator [Rhodobacteraceae bacterium]|nr:MarR family transcriptional regulator [Paracoccaceae bacterium]